MTSDSEEANQSRPDAEPPNPHGSTSLVKSGLRKWRDNERPDCCIILTDHRSISYELDGRASTDSRDLASTNLPQRDERMANATSS